jgi:iron complex outermembrane receptor protein
MAATALLLCLALGAPQESAGAQAWQPEGRPGGEAQTPRPPRESTDKDAEIVVTGARTALPATALPLTVDILGGEDFQRQAAVSGSVVDAVSARIPSFSPTREKLSGLGETLRGRSPLFAINGVPQSTPIRDGSRDAYTIDPFFIDRVEIIYGSNALQGVGGTGGVVNQVTVGAPRTNGVTVRALFQGSFQNGFAAEGAGGKGAALTGWRHGAFDATLGASIEERGAFRDGRGRRIGMDGAQGEIQDSSSRSLFARLGYQVARDARLELVANRFQLSGNGRYVTIAGDRATGLPSSTLRGDPPGTPAQNRADLLSLSFTERDLVGGALTAQFFFSRTRDIFGGGVFAMFQDPSIDRTGRLFDQSVNRSRKLGGKISYERSVPGLRNLVMVAGVDLLSDRTAQTLVVTGREWVPETTFRSVAPFAQGNLALWGGAVRLAGGLRRESVRLDIPDYTTLHFYGDRSVTGGTPTFSRLLKNGGVVLQPMPGLRAYAAYSEGYTIADIGRVLRAVTQPNVRIDDFLDLRPVVSDNREIGVEWQRGALEGGASWFRSSSRFGSLLVRNADGIFDVARQPIRIEGLELDILWRTPVSGLSLGGAYAHVEGRTDGNGDGIVDQDLDGANISPDRLNLFAAWERGRFSGRAALRHYFAQAFDGQDPRNDFAGYTLLDAEAGYSLGRHRLSIAVQNLADRQYITYYSDTQGPTDSLRYFAGRGRTFTLGLTTRW